MPAAQLKKNRLYRIIMPKITDAALRTWLNEERKKHDELKCSELKGFHIRINNDSPEGKTANASYRVRYKVSGKQSTPSICKYGEFTLAKAKSIARNYKANAQIGKDFLKEKREAKEQTKTERLAIANKLPTLQEWYDGTHKDHLIETGSSGKQRTQYLERNWWPKLGHLTGEQLDIDAVAGILPSFKSTLKESTLKKYVDYLKEAASEYSHKHRSTNPLAGTRWEHYVKLAKLNWEYEEDEDSPRTAFPPEDFQRIISCIELLIVESPNHLYALAILFMAYSGMRPGDISTLKWTHLTLNNDKYPYVRKVLTKTKKKRRTPTKIPLNQKAIDTLLRAKPLSGGEYIFSENNKAKTPKSLSDYWRNNVQKNTGIKAPLYQLRHNMAHKILREGGSIADVAAILGNTVEVCIRNYLNNDPEHAATVLQKIKF